MYIIILWLEFLLLSFKSEENDHEVSQTVQAHWQTLRLESYMRTNSQGQADPTPDGVLAQGPIVNLKIHKTTSKLECASYKNVSQ